MTKGSDKDFIEFVLDDEGVSSDEFVHPQVEETPIAFTGTLESSAKLEDMPPAFRELALPKLPELRQENRARLQMQSPNRLFFYWSVGTNPFQQLNKALGARTANYTLVLKLVDLRRDSEVIQPIDPEGSWWFSVEADGEYRAEIGFYSPSSPYVRAFYSNSVTTPRKSPSPRIDTERDWSISADKFAQVLDVAGFTEDAFDVAIAGDDPESAEHAAHDAFSDLIGETDADFESVSADELRHAMLLIASGIALESLRWKISPSLFSILQERPEAVDAGNAVRVLKDRFEIEADEFTEEEFGSAVFGASAINFPRRLRTRRTLPKLRPVSSSSRVPSSGGLS